MHAIRIATISLLVLCLGLPTTPPARADVFKEVGDVLEGVSDLLRKLGLFQGVQISGSDTLTLQENKIEGSETAYSSQRWDTGNVVHQSSLHIEGPIWKEFGFQADISASGFGPSYSRWVVGYVGHDTALYYGDLGINLMGNEFASFSKSLRGWQLDQRLPAKGLARFFYSQEKGFTRVETIPGNNTSGPYFLRYTPIIDGSERVKVDEQLMRFGRDYRLDYETGQLSFDPVDGPPRIIPSTSVITVSYESSGYFHRGGDLYGVRAEMPLKGGKMLVGITRLTQAYDSGRRADTVGFQEDVYQGSGTTGPFDTNFRPIIPNGSSVVYRGTPQTIERALVVLVDGVEQIEGVDYDAYRDLGRIIFRRAVPPTSLVRIRYYYELQTNMPQGKHNILGLDLTYKINDHLALRTDWANSQGGTSAAGGNAWRTQLHFGGRNYSMTTEWRDVAPTFSYIDTVGFFRNERGLTNRLQWRVNDHISLSHSYARHKSSQGQMFGYSGYAGYGGTAGSYYPYQTADTTPGLDIDTSNSDLSIDFNFQGWPTLSFSHQAMSNSGGSRGNSSYDTNSLRLSWAPRSALNISTWLVDTSQRYQRIAADDTVTQMGSTTSRRQLSLSYTPSANLSLSADIGKHRSTALEAADKSSSDTLQLSLSWNPSDKFNVSLARNISSSVGRVSSGFYGGGYGGMYGLPSNAAPGDRLVTGTQDSGDESNARYKDASTNVRISYRPTERLFVDMNLGSRLYTSGGGIGYLADSNQNSRNLSLTWMASDAITLSLTYGRDSLKFLEEGRGTVTNNLLSLNTNYAPPNKPWSVGLALNKSTGQSPTYIGFGKRQHYVVVDTDLFDLNGNLRYKLNDRMSLYAEAGIADFDSGYTAFKKLTSQIGLSQALSRTTSVQFGYRFIKHLAGEPQLPLWTGSGEDYIAHTFMLQLRTQFRGGIGGRSQFQQPVNTFGFGGYGGTSARTFGGYQAGFGTPQRYGYSGPYGGYSPPGPFPGTGGALGGPLQPRTGARTSVPFPGTAGGQLATPGTARREGFETGLGNFQEGTEPGVPQPATAGSQTGATSGAARHRAPTQQAEGWQYADKLSRFSTPQTGKLWQ